MSAKLPGAKEMHALLATEIARCGIAVQSQLEAFFIPLEQTVLRWEYGEDEEFPAWIFADMGERSVVAAYCLGGHGARGSPWGLVFRGDNNFGADYGWFRTLPELFQDWGIGAGGA